MKNILACGLLLAGLMPSAHAIDSANPEIVALNTQIQTQLKAIQAQQQEQIATLNNQLQTQIKQMQATLQDQIQKVNSQTQAQIQTSQAALEKQIAQVQASVNQAKQNN